MAYDPFSRGPFPVGVDTVTLRELTVELWYPAVSSSDGLDLREETMDRFQVAPEAPFETQAAVRDAVARLGSFPLVVVSLARAGHRRSANALCTQLASHGYVVAAADQGDDLGPRAAELSAIIDELVARRGGPGATHLDRERIAVAGIGLGAWAALATIADDSRIAVAVAIAPRAEGADADTLEVLWPRLVPTLIVGVPGDQAAVVHERLRSPRRLLRVGEPDEAARTVIHGVALAHLDAHLRELDQARDLIAGDPAAWPGGAGAAWET